MTDALTEQVRSNEAATGGTLGLFLSSNPLDRDVFVALYNDVVLISALFLVCLFFSLRNYTVLTTLCTNYCCYSPQAPFGLSEFAAYVCGGKEDSVNEYLSLYRCLEECVAKKLFTIKKVSDDVIAATMHVFMEKGDNSEVVQCPQKMYFLLLFSTNYSVVVLFLCFLFRGIVRNRLLSCSD